MLKSLEVTNWKQHTHRAIEFSPGLTMITGPNYSGKSNLVKAIAFALGGVQMITGLADSITTRGEKKSSTKVKLTWEGGGNTYQVERGLSSAKLRENGTVVATGNKAVNEEIEKKIGVDRRTFGLLKYVKQGGTQDLLELGTKLHSLLETLSGADLVAQVVTALSTNVNFEEGRLAAFGNPPENLDQLKQWKADYDVKLPEWHSQIETLEEQLNHAAKAYNDASDKVIEINNYNTEQHRRSQAFSSYVNESRRISDYLDKLIKERDGYTKETDSYNDARTRLTALEEATTELSRLWLRSDGAKKEVAKLSEALLLEEQQLATLVSFCESIVETDEDQRAAAAKARGTSKALGEAGAKAKTLERACQESVCPTCGRPFEGHDPEKLEAELKEALALEEAARAENDAAMRALDEIEAKLKQKHAAEERISRASEDLKSRRENIQAYKLTGDQANEAYEKLLKEVGTDYKERLQILTEAVNKLGAAARLKQQVQIQIADLERQLGSLVKPEEPLPLKEAEEKAAKEGLESVRTQWQDLNSRLTQWKEYYASEYGKWSSWAEDLRREEERASKTAAAEKEVHTSKRLIKFLRKNRDRFMAELWVQITAMASEFCSTCTGGVITAVKRTEDGAFRYVEGGIEDNVVEASGAQRSIMSIGLLVALNRLIPGSFGALILDEPSADMDNAHAAVVTQALSRAGSQLVVISHRDMESAMAGVHISL